MAGFDLHTHTVFSDGTTTPEDNVALAAELGLDGIGVTDHDTTAPFERALAAAEAHRIEVVLGTEFSAELDGLSVHVLGLWVDPGFAPLSDELERLRDERSDRARRIVGRFGELGIDISFDRVVEIADGAPIGRPHIATAVVEAGGADTKDEVFDRYLGDGGPANVEKHAVDPTRAVGLLVAAGGVAVLAHPGLFGSRRDGSGLPDDVIEQLAGAGLAGIEADHPDHSAEQRDRYRDLAAGLRLEVTGGSDYHGEAKVNRLGSSTTPRATVERLRGWRCA